MSTVQTFRTRVLQTLLDVASAIWDNASIDEALRQVVEEYSRSCPLTYETVIELPGGGREIALNTLPGLQAVFDVWWPYDSLAEIWPPNRVRGFHLFWDDSRPVLFLDRYDGDQPQAGQELRLWYSAAHAIAELDSASVTTIPSGHEALIVSGAAAQAAMARALDLAEIAGADLYVAGLIGAWAGRKMKEFKGELAILATKSARSGQPFASGWVLDKWSGA